MALKNMRLQVQKGAPNGVSRLPENLGIKFPRQVLNLTISYLCPSETSRYIPEKHPEAQGRIPAAGYASAASAAEATMKRDTPRAMLEQDGCSAQRFSDPEILRRAHPV